MTTGWSHHPISTLLVHPWVETLWMSEDDLVCEKEKERRKE